MKVLFASFREHYPHRVDGAIISAHVLLDQLRQRGHECEAVATISERPWWSFQAYRVTCALSLGRVLGWTDRANGYATHRSWNSLLMPLFERRIREWAPDLVLTQLEGSAHIARLAARQGVPAMLYVHDAEFWWQDDSLGVDPRILLVSTSHHVAQRVGVRLGLFSPVLHPIVLRDHYLAPRRDPRFVTMVNPVPEKGIEVTLQIARLLPDREFLLVETWPLAGPQREELLGRIAELPNVTLHPVCQNMRSIYGRTALLLAPSQWEEAFGRVILEAQLNGIPVVASRSGGIPEVLQSGGELLPAAAPPAVWAERIEAILSDVGRYESTSAAARSNAARADFEPAAILDRFETLAEEHLQRGRAPTVRTRAGNTSRAE